MNSSTTPSPPVLLAPALVDTDQRIVLSGDQATHGLRARRIRQGDPLLLTNGSGLLADGRAQEIDLRNNVLLVRIDAIERVGQSRPSVVLAAALPKGDRLSTMLDMATQLGISQFIPLDCEFSVVRYRHKMKQRWQRIFESATKQSRRAWIPTVGESMSICQVVENAASDDLLLFGDHRAVRSATTSSPDCSCTRIVVLVGPEGGFSNGERTLLGDSPLSVATVIGNHVLRTETAAIALIAAANLMIRDRCEE